jgi:FtsH-binding integral membrane protein
MHTGQMVPAIERPEIDRATFVGKVYKHVAAALAAFLVFEVILFSTGIAGRMEDFFLRGGGGRWLLLLGGVMVANAFVSKAATDLLSPQRQYFGLFGSALIEAIIFAPFLSYVLSQDDGTDTLLQAAVITGIGFAILTGIGLFTKSDLSWMRPIMMWGFGLAILAIIGGVMFGFNLGLWFSVAMIGLAGISILYQTQSVVRRYPVDAYVAAAVGVFSSLMMMFWYVLRLLMSRD